MKNSDWLRVKFKYWLIGAGCTALIGMGNLRPAKAADRLTTYVGPIQISMQLDDLERFAQDGTAQGNVKLLARRLDSTQLSQFRQLLQRKFQLSPTTISRLLNTPMADDLLQRIGSVIEVSSGQNGADAIRSAVLQSAEQPDGFTPLDVLRLYPSTNLRINLSSVLRLRSEFETLLAYSRASVQAIEQEAASEAAASRIAANLPDLRLAGVNSVTKYQKTFSIEAIRPTALGLASRYDLNVDIYVPDNLTSPAPVIVQTHGFGASRDNYEYISEHLASHGFVVVAPEHLGSNLEYRQSLLEGHLSELLNPMEYISRPLDITYMLDQLEQLAATDPDWKQRLNLQQVGIFGYSFGGTTALSSAGATIDIARLRSSCSDPRLMPSPSVLIMCRAQHLPVEAYDLVDPRIKAVIAAYPLTSLIFGPAGMSHISVPTLILSGSRDIVAPSVPEQVEPFLWLTTPHKYLALMVPGTHFSTSDIRYSGQYPEAIRGPNTAIGQDYLRTLSVAFFQTYLNQDSHYLPYLTSAYTKSISQEAMQLYLVQSLTAEQLQSAYGGPLPRSLAPERIAETTPASSQDILAEIAQTGVLKVGIRTDAAPFGYIGANGQWTGYCYDWLNAFRQKLTATLDRQVEVELVPLPSNIDNRFELVQKGQVQLECGPNTIREGIKDVTFSEPFFYTGTQFLTMQQTAAQFNPDALAGVKIGVLRNSTTEQFVQRQYPRSRIVRFDGATGTEAAVTALTAGEISAFADDSVLLRGELLQQQLSPANYALLPQQPLTCDAYGMILPADDRNWRNQVNEFLRSEQSTQLRNQWLADNLPEEISTLGYCLDRQF